MSEPKLIASVRELPLADIEVGTDRVRPYSETAVQTLIQVIQEYGFTVPIIVRKKARKWILVDGGNRLEAMQRIGAESIAVRAYHCTENQALGLEISSNLAGNALSPLDDAVFLAQWRRVYEEAHPETRKGVAGGKARQGTADDKLSFAALVAEKRSTSVRQVQRVAKAGEVLTRDEVSRLRLSPKRIANTDIETIGKITENEERAFVVKSLVSGEAKNASTARKLYAAETGNAPGPVDPVDAEFQALLKAWGRARKSARARFIDHIGNDLLEMQEGGDD